MRVLSFDDLRCVSGGESDPNGPGAGHSGDYGSYGITDLKGPDLAGAIGAGLSTVGGIIQGPFGVGLAVVGGVISTASAAGYTVSQAHINAGFIEYGMSLAEASGGNYGGSTFGNDFGDPNGPGANSNVA